MKTGFLGIVVVAFGAVSLSGCVTDPQKAATTMQPKTPVVKTMTNLSQAKACMDELFLEGARSGIPITSDTIDDATSSVKVSTQDMTINAISDMTKRSGAFQFVQLEDQRSMIWRMQELLVPIAQHREVAPPVYIRGSISQADNNVLRDNASVGITVPFASIGKGQDQNIDMISIDLQIVDLTQRTVLPGMTVSNTITVVSDSDSQSARGLIQGGSFGAALSVSLASSRREGRGQAVRTLLEYSLIELLGKYTHVPYHRCLELPSTDPASMQAAQDYYDTLSPQQRTKAVQTALIATHEYSGPIDGIMTQDLQAAISRAKLKRDLVGNGRIDFQLFNALYDENILPNQTVVATADPAVAPPPTGPTKVGGSDPFGLSLALANPVLRRNSKVNVQVSVTSPAQVYCYYEFIENGAVHVSRIFPNRFQTDNYVLPGQVVSIPRPNGPFEIMLNATAPESIGCVATSIQYKGANALPLLDEPDLNPIVTPVDWTGLAYVLYQHQQVDTFRTTVRKIQFQVNG